MAARSDGANANCFNECSICLGDFKTPKFLPCSHTFCLECLIKYGEGELPGDEMTCPLCRQMFKIPARGFEKLPNNFYIEQRLSSLRLLTIGSSGSGVKCEGCEKTNAKTYCVDCAQSMCNRCLVTHGKLKVTQSHKVVSLSEKEGS